MAQMSSADGPRSADSLSLISLAALLVKVMAMMLQGAAGSTWQSQSARRRSSGEAHSSIRSRKATSSSVNAAGISLQSLPLPKRIRLAIRLMSTVVLPLPAPASRSSGPSVVRTAFCCMSFNWENWVAIYFFLAVKNLFSNCSVIATPVSFRMGLFYSIFTKR